MSRPCLGRDHPRNSGRDDRPLVLAIHGTPTVRHALLVTFELYGFDVCIARDATEATVLLTDGRPQAVVADATGSVEDTIGLLRRLRADAETVGIPVILLRDDSAHSTADDVFLEGIDAVLYEGGVAGPLELLHASLEAAGSSPGGRRM